MLTRDAGGSEMAIHEIRQAPDVHEACVLNRDLLARAAEPCGREAVNLALTRLAAVYGVPWDDDTTMAVAKEAYFDALAAQPLDALVAGVRDYEASGEAIRFPKPGPLRKLVEVHGFAIRAAAYRARRACELEPKARPVVTPEERARIARDLAALKGQIAARAKPTGAPPQDHAQRHAMAEALREHDTHEREAGALEEFV